MNKGDKTILVTGATGQQGSAVVRHLLKSGWPVRALTRDKTADKAKALAQAGVEVVEGTLDEIASVQRALQGVYGVFGMQPPAMNGYSTELELIHGKRLGDLAAEAGVQHFVYSSAGGADRNSPLPHVDSKWQIEQHLRRLSLPLTVLYPVFFMENLNWNRPQIADGTFAIALKPETRLQLIASEDIGAFAALAFNNPDTYIGASLEIAGDERNMVEMAAIFSSVLGKPVTFVEVSLEQLAHFAPDMVEMMREFQLKTNQADINDLRERHPDLMSLEQWLVRTGWNDLVREQG